MRSTSSLLSLRGPLKPGVAAPGRVLYILFLFVCFGLWHRFQTIHFTISTEFTHCQKHFYIQAIQFSQAVLIQTIQFRISIVLVYTQTKEKTILFTQFSLA